MKQILQNQLIHLYFYQRISLRLKAQLSLGRNQMLLGTFQILLNQVFYFNFYHFIQIFSLNFSL